MTKQLAFFRSIFACFFPCCLALLSCLAAQGMAAESDIWLVKSHAGEAADVETLQFFQLQGRSWKKWDAETFYSTQNAEIPLIVYAPGYTTTTEDTVMLGMKLTSLYKKRGESRTVFWKWPSEKVDCRLIPDIRSKLPIVTQNAELMAAFLRKLQSRSKVCMIGFSFGNRIILDAAESLATNPSDRSEHFTFHLVLAAAATDADSLGKGGRHENVPEFCEKILVLYNPEDSKLLFYPFLYGRHSLGKLIGPESLGKQGPPLSRICPENREHIEAININRYVGSEHKTVDHIMTPSFRNRVDSYLLFQ